ncbi:MAG: hypothetical protein AAF436_17125 [Myxococcota bacterium]
MKKTFTIILGVAAALALVATFNLSSPVQEVGAQGGPAPCPCYNLRTIATGMQGAKGFECAIGIDLRGDQKSAGLEAFSRSIITNRPTGLCGALYGVEFQGRGNRAICTAEASAVVDGECERLEPVMETVSNRRQAETCFADLLDHAELNFCIPSSLL